MRDAEAPEADAFTARERRILARLRTPTAVQRWLNALPYNTEPPPGRATLRSFRGVVSHGTAHCLEAALAAAVILEQHGYPPLVLSFESIDELDHVLFVYRARGRWGSIARSRDPGLHGRRPVFRTARALALSYVDPYVDFTGRITGYQVVDLRVLGRYDWRLSDRNVWKVERMLLNVPHRPIRSSDARIDRLRRRYVEFRTRYPDRRPVYYRGRDTWTEIPREAVSPGRSRASASSRAPRGPGAAPPRSGG
ncbi:MAG TPA: hypothetical protein VFK20_01260 [Vicinamibacterales bacterium]|nr:hypothetical protein [Vicinamibacterales bacterium]